MGSEAAFRKLFDTYREPFFRAAFKMTRSTHTAEEIVQDVFVQLWTKREQVAAADKPDSYLVVMLHNTIYSHFRKLAQEKAVLKNIGKDEDWEAATAEAILLDKDNKALLEAVIDGLPPQQRTVYQLRQEGFSREEIAARLQISPNTVKNHLLQATKAVQEYFRNNRSAFIWLAIWQSL